MAERPAAALGLLPAVFVLLWSTGFIVAKYAAPHAPPLTFLAWRFAGVVLALLPLIWWMRAPWPRSALAIWRVAVTGVLLQAIYLGGVWFAIAEGMPAAVSALIVGVQPLCTALFAAQVGESVSRRQWAGLALGFGGVTLVLAERLTLAGIGPLPLAVNLLALVGITAGTLYQKRHGVAVDLRTGMAIQFAASFAVTLPLALLLEDRPIDFVAGFWVALAWSVFVLSLGAMLLLLVMIRRGRATQVASLLYLTPPTTAVLAFLLFGERLGAVAWAGVALTSVAVAIVIRSPSPRPS